MKIKNYNIHFETSNSYMRLYWGSLLPTIMYAIDVSHEHDYINAHIKFLFLKFHLTIMITKNIENLPF